MPSACTSTVAWPIQVTRISLPSTRAGGLAGVTATRAGQAGRVGSPKICCRNSRLRRAAEMSSASPSGLKKRCPSKWPVTGPR